MRADHGDVVVLCIQTKFQKDMLLKHYSKIICAGSSHKTTHYDIHLTSVLVLDEYKEALPVPLAISNREDSDILNTFFQAVR